MSNLGNITVRKHSGRSGKSAYGWRVYREWNAAPGRKAGRLQLAKAKTQQAAEDLAERYRGHDAKWCSHCQRFDLWEGICQHCGHIHLTAAKAA